MAVRTDTIRRGEYFIAANQELRKVTRIETGQGRCCVHYQHKNAAIPNRPFLFAHSPDAAPAIEDFARECERRLGFLEIRRLRLDGILLAYE